MAKDRIGDILESDGYIMSDHAKDLLNSGFEGNGCGCGFFSFQLSKIAQKMFKVDYSIACLIHDAEWSIDSDYKTDHARILSNAHFEINLILGSCGAGGEGLTPNKLRLAAWFHMAVTSNPKGY